MEFPDASAVHVYTTPSAEPAARSCLVPFAGALHVAMEVRGASASPGVILCNMRRRGSSLTCQTRTEPSFPADITHVGLAMATARTPPLCAALILPTFSPSAMRHTAREPSSAPETTVVPSVETWNAETAALCDPNRNTMLPVSPPSAGRVEYRRFGDPICEMRSAPACCFG
jgi:hypothetical protein